MKNLNNKNEKNPAQDGIDAFKEDVIKNEVESVIRQIKNLKRHFDFDSTDGENIRSSEDYLLRILEEWVR